jgi:hypothetical protein
LGSLGPKGRQEPVGARDSNGKVRREAEEAAGRRRQDLSVARKEAPGRGRLEGSHCPSLRTERPITRRENSAPDE